jgi:transposase
MMRDGGSCAGARARVVTWRRAQMVLLSAQGMDVPAIAKVAFTSEDRVRDLIRNFNADGFSSLYRNTAAGGHGLPFSAWSLAKLAEFLVAEAA